MASELARLKQHLLQIEESYTSELLQADSREQQLNQQLNALQAELLHVQQRVGNDHTLTALRTEAEHALHQRDQALQRVTHLEDDLARAQAAQSNLQAVMEQLMQGTCCTADMQPKSKSVRQQLCVQLFF